MNGAGNPRETERVPRKRRAPRPVWALSCLLAASLCGCAFDTAGEPEPLGTETAELGVEDDLRPPPVGAVEEDTTAPDGLLGDWVVESGDPLDPHPDPWKEATVPASPGADEDDSGDFSAGGAGDTAGGVSQPL
ncbi:MAG: hypothetical protein HY908_08810 [Myxococcales bacterium]|nr:hypothetical protein [Myxococcales bacterium]